MKLCEDRTDGGTISGNAWRGYALFRVRNILKSKKCRLEMIRFGHVWFVCEVGRHDAYS